MPARGRGGSGAMLGLWEPCQLLEPYPRRDMAGAVDAKAIAMLAESMRAGKDESREGSSAQKMPVRKGRQNNAEGPKESRSRDRSVTICQIELVVKRERPRRGRSRRPISTKFQNQSNESNSQGALSS